MVDNFKKQKPYQEPINKPRNQNPERAAASPNSQRPKSQKTLKIENLQWNYCYLDSKKTNQQLRHMTRFPIKLSTFYTPKPESKRVKQGKQEKTLPFKAKTSRN